VSHTDPAILALRALGETAGSAGDAEHAETCAHCRAELARLTEVVRLSRDEGAKERLEAPPPQVWNRIAAAVGAGQPPAVPALNGASAPAALDAGKRQDSRARRPRRRLATGLAGLAAGLIIGIGGTAGIYQLTRAPATRVVAQIELSRLPQFPQWQDAAGTAVMRAAASQQLMVVTLRVPRKPGFY